MRVGIDLGGTAIKAAVVSSEGAILSRAEGLTPVIHGMDAVLLSITELAREALGRMGLALSDCGGLGVGAPGATDASGRVLVTSPNLPVSFYPLADRLEALTGVPVFLGNDANCAVLGEQIAGAAKETKDAVLLTLGTGVGGGVLIGGRLLVGFNGAAGELGHMVIVKGGLPCPCGRLGCLEAYASVSALVRQAACVMKDRPDSALWGLTGGNPARLDGRVIFEAADAGDETALAVLEQYEEYVAEGAANMINIFEPEVLIIGGGISRQGEKLLAPIREKTYRRIYCAEGLPRTRIVAAQLDNDAGLVGAAALVAP